MRKSKRSLIILAASLAGLLLMSPGTANELSRGAILSASCEGCHGTNGHSPGSMPDISGNSAEYIQATLESFKSGEAKSTVMERQAKGYTDEEIQLIAEYFARQK